MRILTHESPDKTVRRYRDISRDELLACLRSREDHGWHEVIPMLDSGQPVRVYFDVDAEGLDPVELRAQILSDLVRVFGGMAEHWAIASCHRDNKASFHVLSRLYRMPLRKLRQLTAQFPWADTSAYWFSFQAGVAEEGSLRLPWQSKGAVNKAGPPLVIEAGDEADFLVTDLTGLSAWPHSSPSRGTN